MQRLPVIAHLSAEEVRRRYRTCPDPTEKTRWHLIWLLLHPGESLSCERAASLVGLSDVYARAVLKRWNAHGPAGLADRRQANGRAARLTEQNIQELEELLLQGATVHGWPNNLWTSDRVAQVIQKHFGAQYHPGHVFTILKKRLHWSCQRPKHVNIKHDDAEIARWVREEFPRIVQEAALRGAYVVFVDETGFLLEPTLRRTWAPRGHTPVNKVSNPHARISAIAAITVSPRPRRLGLVYHLLADNVNFRGPAIAQYLGTLHSIIGAPMTVVWDQTAIHHCTAVDRYLAKEPSVVIEPFPPYASELDPADGIWRYIKYGRIPNYTPPDLSTLRRTVENELLQLKTRVDLLESFIRFTNLPIDFEASPVSSQSLIDS